MIPLDALPSRSLRIGTRGSALALAQTKLVADLVGQLAPDIAVETVVIASQGDLDQVSPLSAIGGRGVFTNALEQTIVCGQVDAAVHSAKDLPTTLPVGLPLVAFPQRGDPRDVLVSRHGTTLDRLPPNPVIGTSSRRRATQILRLRPDARIENLRGNIDTRLRKAESEAYDAIVLAAAGLERMGWGNRASQVFSVDEMVPSPGQGAIAVQAAEASPFLPILTRLDDPRVALAVQIERAFLAAIGAGCTLPVGAYATEEGDAIRLHAFLSDDAGERVAFADELLGSGDKLLQAREIALRMTHTVQAASDNAVWHGYGDLGGARIAVTRPTSQAGPLLTALAARGARPVSLSTIRIEHVEDTSQIDAALRAASDGAYDWLIVTSVNAADVVGKRLAALGLNPAQLSGMLVAAVGQATAAALHAIGLPISMTPEVATGDAMLAVLQKCDLTGVRMLFPRSAIGNDQLPTALRAAGAVVNVVDAYRTLPVESLDPGVLEMLRRDDIDAITFSSPSSVDGLLTLLGEERSLIAGVPAVCAGPVTEHAARLAGLCVAVVSSEPGAVAIADAVVALWRERRGSHSHDIEESLVQAHQGRERTME